MTSFKLSLLAGAASLALTTGTEAKPITFTYMISSGSGTIGSTPFTNQPITITANGDTSNVVPSSSSYVLKADTASVTIGSLGPYKFVTGLEFGASHTPGIAALIVVFRADPPNVDLVDGPSFTSSSANYAAVAAWQMTTPIGPLSSQGTVNGWNPADCNVGPPCSPPITPITTNAGDMVVFDSAKAITLTFSATMAPTFAGTPGTLTCFAQSIAAVAQEFKGLTNAAALLNYARGLPALEEDIITYCNTPTS